MSNVRMMVPMLGLFFAAVLGSAAWGADYLIGEGDGLTISVWGVQELNVPVKVRPDGKITIPGLGDVVASGRTPSQLQQDLAVKLKDLVKNPIVTVSVSDITNSRAYVFGGGVASSVFDISRRTSLLQLLCSISRPAAASASSASSPGMAGTIDYDRAYVLRNGKKVKEGFRKLLLEGDTSEDILIENSDAIFIPELAEKNVYVLGAVATPKFIPYRDGLTVMEAVLDAGGFTKFARENHTQIFRKEGGKEHAIAVKAKDLIDDGDLTQNVRLKPGDYIVVEEGIF